LQRLTALRLPELPNGEGTISRIAEFRNFDIRPSQMFAFAGKALSTGFIDNITPDLAQSAPVTHIRPPLRRLAM
jgi:hypothetical protein